MDKRILLLGIIKEFSERIETLEKQFQKQLSFAGFDGTIKIKCNGIGFNPDQLKLITQNKTTTEWHTGTKISWYVYKNNEFINLRSKKIQPGN